MEGLSIQLILAVATVAGAGISTYVGIKIALAEHRKDIQYLQKDMARLESEQKEIEKKLDNLNGVKRR